MHSVEVAGEVLIAMLLVDGLMLIIESKCRGGPGS
jgi:hypothetical protein